LLVLLGFVILLVLCELLFDHLRRYHIATGQQVVEHFRHLSGSNAVFLDLSLLGGHVVDGVLIDGKEVEVGQLVVLVVGTLEVL
jgi:hypothetical protein